MEEDNKKEAGRHGINAAEILAYLTSSDENKFADDIQGFVKDCGQLAKNMIALYDEKAPAMLIGDVQLIVQVRCGEHEMLSVLKGPAEPRENVKQRLNRLVEKAHAEYDAENTTPRTRKHSIHFKEELYGV